MSRAGRALRTFLGTLLVAALVLGTAGGFIGRLASGDCGSDLCGVGALAGLLAGVAVAAVIALAAAAIGWRRPEASPLPQPALRPWQVVEPGVDLADDPDSHRTVGHLEAGVTVIEYHRFGEHLLVGTRDGLTGWVAEDRLRPPQEVEGGGDG